MKLFMDQHLSAAGTITENSSIPCGLLTGSTVIMRVRLSREFGTPSTNCLCCYHHTAYGEIEEYYVTIGPPMPSVAPVGGNVTFGW